MCLVKTHPSACAIFHTGGGGGEEGKGEAERRDENSLRQEPQAVSKLQNGFPFRQTFSN